MLYLESNKNDFFSREKTTVIKGICICMIFMHHLVQYLSISRLYSITDPIGPVAVDMFFFIAGYAMLHKLERLEKAEYGRFILDRALRVYLPITLMRITDNNFLCGLIWMYAATILAYRFLEAKYRVLFVFAANVLFIFVCIKLGLGAWWYERVLPYSLGALFFKRKEWVLQFFRDKWVGIVTLLSSLMLSGFFMWMALTGGPFSLNVFVYSVNSIIYSVFLCIALVSGCYFWGAKSIVFTFLGKLSFEIFMLHQMMFQIFNRFADKKPVFLVLTFISTIIAAVILQKAWNVVRKNLMGCFAARNRKAG